MLKNTEVVNLELKPSFIPTFHIQLEPSCQQTLSSCSSDDIWFSLSASRNSLVTMVKLYPEHAFQCFIGELPSCGTRSSRFILAPTSMSHCWYRWTSLQRAFLEVAMSLWYIWCPQKEIISPCPSKGYTPWHGAKPLHYRAALAQSGSLGYKWGISALCFETADTDCEQSPIWHPGLVKLGEASCVVWFQA